MNHEAMEHAGQKDAHQGGMGQAGHDHHAMMIADFQRRFWAVLVLTVPVLALSPMIQHWLGLHLVFAGSGYLLAGLASMIFVYGGWPFLTGWYAEMKKWNPGMMTLIEIFFVMPNPL